MSIFIDRVTVHEEENLLLVLNFIPFADKAFLVFLSHVAVVFVHTEKAFSAKLAHRMDTTLDLFRRYLLHISMVHRWQVHR